MAPQTWAHTHIHRHNPWRKPEHQINISVTYYLLYLSGQGVFGHLLVLAFFITNALLSVSQQGNLKAAFRQLHFAWWRVSKVVEAFRLQWKRLALCLMSLEEAQTFGFFHPCSSERSQLAQWSKEGPLLKKNSPPPPFWVLSFFTSLSIQVLLFLYLSRLVSLPGPVVSSVGSAQHQCLLWSCTSLLVCLLAVNALPCFFLLLLH